MSFQPIRDNRGFPKLSCFCDECERVEVVAADHTNKGGLAKQALPKLKKLGWTYVGKKLRCGACEAKRKVVNMTEHKAKSPSETAPRVPTRAQKLQIMDLLKDVYDVDQERYRRGDTDESVADVLDVMPGWVTQLREEFFGPAGCNEDMAALRAQIEALIVQGGACIDELQKKGITPLLEALSEAEDIRKRLAGIEKAVGPRVVSRVKV